MDEQVLRRISFVTDDLLQVLPLARTDIEVYLSVLDAIKYLEIVELNLSCFIKGKK